MGRKPALRPAPTSAAPDLVETAVIVATDLVKKASLGPVETLLLSKMDGQRTVADLASLANLSLRETTAVLARMEQLGLVRVEHEVALDEVALDEDWDPTLKQERTPAKRSPTE